VTRATGLVAIEISIEGDLAASRARTPEKAAGNRNFA
jgi:hypothetical protein